MTVQEAKDYKPDITLNPRSVTNDLVAELGEDVSNTSINIVVTTKPAGGAVQICLLSQQIRLQLSAN